MEALAAPAAPLGVRVFKNKFRSDVVLDVVHSGAHEYHQRLRVDYDLHSYGVSLGK